MAIAVVYKAPAMTAEQYIKSWEGGPPVAPPTGLIFHAGVGDLRFARTRIHAGALGYAMNRAHWKRGICGQEAGGTAQLASFTAVHARAHDSTAVVERFGIDGPTEPERRRTTGNVAA